jgi:hypothetical protein
VVRYCEYGVISLQHGEFSDEVNGYSFERRSFQFGPDGLKRCFSGMVIDFVLLTFGTSFYIVRYFSAQSQPPAVSFDELDGSSNPWMPVYWHVMMSSDHCSGSRPNFGDHSPAVLVPHFVYFLQLVSIDPLG